MNGDYVDFTIPASIMMFSKDVIAYVFFSDETCSMTVLEIKIPIIPRQRPADYIYTPEQV